MRKRLFGIIATLAVASAGVLGLAAPAMAAQVTSIDSWNTTVTPEKDGKVAVESTVSPIAAGDSLDIAFPIVSKWDAVEGWSEAKSLNYAYTNFNVSEGYKLKVTTREGTWAIVSIQSAPKDGAAQTEPLTFSYVANNAIFNSQDKKFQQLNLPLIDETFNATIAKYTVNVDKAFGAEAICVRNTMNSDSGCLPASETETSFVSEVERKAGERVSLRAKYPAGAFADLTATDAKTETGEVAEKALPAPTNYLREFKSWNGDVVVNNDGTIQMNNTIVYDSTKSNADNIVVAYDVTNADQSEVYNYKDFALTGDSAALYDLSVEKDDYKVHPDGHYLVTLAKKPVLDADGNPVITQPEIDAETGEVVPKLETVTFSYNASGFTTDGKATGVSNEGDDAKLTEVVLKSSSPKIAVENVQLVLDKASSPVPMSAYSVCSADRGSKYDCDVQNDGFVYKAKGNINTDYFVIYEFNPDDIAIGGAAATTGDEKVNNKPEVKEPVDLGWLWGLLKILGWVVGIALAAFLIVFFFRKARFGSLAKLATTSAGLYKVASNKPATFIPAVADLNPLKGRKVSKAAAKAQKSGVASTIATAGAGNIFDEKTFAPPRLDDGGEIKPYIYPFLSQKDEKSAMLTSALSLVMSLASKDAIRIVHDKNGRAGIDVQADTVNLPLTPIERITLQEIVSQTQQGGKPMISPRLLEKITDNTRLGNMITDEVKQLNFFEEKGGLFAKGNTGRTVGTGVSTVGALASGAVVVGGIATGGILPIVLGAGGLIAASAGLGKSAVKLGRNQKVRTVTGTGYLARMEAFRNYFKVARPESRYSLERADVDGKYLPWAVVFDLPEKWVDVFSAPTSATGKNVLISGNAYPSDVLSKSMKSVLDAINIRREDTKGEEGPLLDPNRF
jgi:hypothetical protein